MAHESSLVNGHTHFRPMMGGGRGRLALLLFGFTASVESDVEEDKNKTIRRRRRMNFVAVQYVLVAED